MARIFMDAQEVVVLGENSRIAIINGTLQGTHVHITVAEPLRVGAAVQIETNNMLLLGTVHWSFADPLGYRIGIGVEHSIPDLGAVRRWMTDVKLKPAPKSARAASA